MNGRNILIAGGIVSLFVWVGMFTVVKWLVVLCEWVF